MFHPSPAFVLRPSPFTFTFTYLIFRNPETVNANIVYLTEIYESFARTNSPLHEFLLHFIFTDVFEFEDLDARKPLSFSHTPSPSPSPSPMSSPISRKIRPSTSTSLLSTPSGEFLTLANFLVKLLVKYKSERLAVNILRFVQNQKKTWRTTPNFFKDFFLVYWKHVAHPKSSPNLLLEISRSWVVMKPFTELKSMSHLFSFFDPHHC